MAFLSIPFLSFYLFHIIFLLTSTGQTDKPISMVESSNDTFSPKQVPFGDLIEKKFEFTGSRTLKNRQKNGRGLWFPSQTRIINKNSYLSQINRYRHRI
jgi:hypothetical protein